TGKLAQSWGFSAICYASSALAFPMVILAFYRPTALFADFDPAIPLAENKVHGYESLTGAVKRLLASRSALIAASISLLWDFTPGWNTPLFYYYINTLRFSDSQFEWTTTALTAASTLSALSYAFLCFKFSKR